jgi:hypothetical protein
MSSTSGEDKGKIEDSGSEEPITISVRFQVCTVVVVGISDSRRCLVD